MEEVLALCIPIAICVILPIAIVAIVMSNRNKTIQKKSEVIMKAIEQGVDIDPKNLVLSEAKSVKGLKEKLFGTLKTGFILTALGLAFTIFSLIMKKIEGDIDHLIVGLILLTLGISFIVSFFVGKMYLAKEIEAEERELENKE